jgi:hypothetical protein
MFPRRHSIELQLAPSARAATALGNRDPEKAIAALAVSGDIAGSREAPIAQQ